VTEREAWLALNAAELPPRKALDLLDHHHSPTALLSASPSAGASRTPLTRAEAARLAKARAGDYRAHLDKLATLGCRLVAMRDAEYPANLRQIYDPPPVLFVRGALLPADERAVAIVGTRRVTPYGRLVSESLGRDLAARSITVVSGLAVGADAAAHRGALSSGGRTIGVLACGIDVPYPRDTLALREQAASQGAVISEVPLGTPARGGRFHARNRLISGLSLGVVVTEAPERSGALITANFAANQGRQVFAVPGSVNSEFSRGTHALLRDGARLVESVADILDELALPEPSMEEAPVPSPRHESAPVGLTDDEQAILDVLSLQQRHVDEVIQGCDIPSSRASSGLLMLELKGLVRRLPGSMFMRVR
jgi:DNA processing protein